MNLIGPPPLAPELFDLDPDVLWVMHCAEGPVPRAAVAALLEFLPRETRPWTLRFQEDFVALPRRTREAAARLVGARPPDVTLTPTTSSGLVLVAQGYPWEPGDEVVAPLGEFPSNAWPWKALEKRGVTFREVPLWDGHRAGREAWESAPPTADADAEARLVSALGERTRVLTVSWVRFQDGWVSDLRRLAAGCAERGVDLVVDGIQGAGTLTPELEGVAAFATGGHKGLLAPQGLGFLWTDPEFRLRLAPGGSWLSVEEATNFARPSTDFDRDWAADGSRLEPGVPNLVGCVMLRASLRLLAEAGVERVAAHVASLRRRLIDALEGMPEWREEARRLGELDAAGRLGAIVSLHHGGRGAEALDAVLRDGFARGIYASVREGYLRVALHGWHTGGDVDRIVEWLDAGS